MTTTGRPGRALDDLVVRDRSWPKIALQFRFEKCIHGSLKPHNGFQLCRKHRL